LKLFIFYKHFLAYPNFSNFTALQEIRLKHCWCRTYPARSWRSWYHLRSYSTKLVHKIQGRSHQPSRGTTPQKTICCRPCGPLSNNWGQTSYKYMAIVTGAWSFPMDYSASSSLIREDKQKMHRCAPRFDRETSRRTCENLQRTSCELPGPAFLPTNRNMWRKMDLSM